MAALVYAKTKVMSIRLNFKVPDIFIPTELSIRNYIHVGNFDSLKHSFDFGKLYDTGYEMT